MPPVTAHPTAEALIEAGFRLAESVGLAGLTINAVVEMAGVAKGTFYVHFATRDAYLVELHRQFHARLRRRIEEATADLAPGAERLRLGTQAYLDGCLASQAVKALLQEARSVPAILEEVRRSDDRFAKDAGVSLAVMGFPAAAPAARLFIAMAAEAAIAELEAGHELPEMRRALWRLIGIER